MQVNKSLKLLKKINSVYHSLIDGSESVSRLEQELLKRYVIQFYDSLIDEAEINAEVEQKPAIKIEPAATQEERILAKEVDEVVVSSQSQESTVSVARPEPIIIDKRVEQAEQLVAEPIVVEDQKPDLISDLLAEVAQNQESSHIGERFVSDLKKSMGLNDKLRYANELFGGNQSRLLETLDMLNESPTLDDVRGHLNVIASEFQWLEDPKRESASRFLQLVHRKFNKS